MKLVLRNNKYLVETTDAEILQMLLKDHVIAECRVHGAEQITTSAPKMAGLAIAGSKEAAGVKEAEGLSKNPEKAPANPTTKDIYDALNDDDDDDDQDIVHAFQIRDDAVSQVTKRCLDLEYPALEEYDFRNDNLNANLEIDLQPATQIRPYQEKSLSKMFGNGRAKSGIIVLPCGAGKTLVGITAACTIKKGVIVLATSNMSVIQWRNEFHQVVEHQSRRRGYLLLRSQGNFQWQYWCDCDDLLYGHGNPKTIARVPEDDGFLAEPRVGPHAAGRGPRCPCADVFAGSSVASRHIQNWD